MRSKNISPRKTSPLVILVLFSLVVVFFPQLAFAYVGPGTGLSAIGALLALVVGSIVAILGFLWYPIKRLFSRKKLQQEESDGEKVD